MYRKLLKLLTGLFLIVATSAFAQDIVGYWKTINENTNKPESIVAIYEYQGKYYGRLISSFDPTGKKNDNIYNPKDRAPGVVGNPYYMGLDFIWDLKKDGDRYRGKILDPEKGNIYNAEIWVEDGNLIVRGKIFFFGRNQTWPPAQPSDFPPGFKMPDTSKFVPVIPNVE